MKIFDYKCSRGCGKVFEVFVDDPTKEVVKCPRCHIPCEKQPGGKFARTHGDHSIPTTDVPRLSPRDYECRERVLARAEHGNMIFTLIEHSHVPKAKA